MPFNEGQRRSLRERDTKFGRKDNPTAGCNFPHNHVCGVACKGRLEVHHIVPQRYAREKLKAPPEKIDHPLNAITICQNSHVGTPRSVHPDNVDARREYAQGNKNSYKQMFEKRGSQVAQGDIYWNPKYDRELRAQAAENTRQANKEGWEFPKKGVIYNRRKNQGRIG